MKHFFSATLFILLGWGSANAQQAVISGTVVNDSTGKPVAFATIEIGGNKNTATDADGFFKLALQKATGILTVTAVGYKPVKINISAVVSEPLMIRLKPNEILMQDVTVSTGYQVIPKERATGSFEVIDNKLLNRSVSPDIITRLEGVTSGLYFNKATGTREIFVRGLSTLRASTQPLIVIDNFPYEGSLDNIDPDNIESITILKDASGASIWGAKAGNGVIVITAKKGKYNQSPRVDVNSNLTYEAKPRLFKDRNFMSVSDFISVERMLFDNGYYDNNLANTYSYPVISPVVELLAKQREGIISAEEANSAINTFNSKDIRNDYLHYLFRPAMTQQYSATLSGGTNNMSYLLGFGYDRKLTSVVGNQGYRANVNARLAIKPVPKLEIQTTINYTLAADRYNGISAVSPGGYKSAIYPYAALVDNTGKSIAVLKDYRMGYTDTTGSGYLLNWKYNPLDEVKNSDNRITRNDIQLNISVKYEFSKSLNAEVKGQMERTGELSNYFYSQQTYYARNIINRFSQRAGDIIQHNVPAGGILDRGNNELLTAGLRGQLNYNAQLSKWYQFNAIAGAEIRNVQANGQVNRTYGYDDDVLSFSMINYNEYYTLWDNLGADVIERYTDFAGTVNRYVSYFGNAALTMRNKYIVSASIRKDASNLFGVNTNQKWNPFWSAGFAWKVSDESFYRLKWLPALKARITYGYSGNIIPGLSGKPVISYSNNYIIPVPYATTSYPANPNLRWEKTGTFNAGIDFGFAKEKFSGSIDYYIKKSTDLFGYTPVDPTTGVSIAMLNAANLRSSGFNIKLNATVVDKVIKWDMVLLIDHVKNRVTKYFNEYANKGGYTGFGNTITPLAGKDPYALISYKWAGLDPVTGDPQGYIGGHISKDYFALTRPTSFNDLSIKGSTRPTLYGSFRNNVSFKGFTLSANIGYAFGYYFRRAGIDYTALFDYWSMNIEFADRWQKPGDEAHTSVPSMVYPASYLRDNFYNYSEATVEKGDNIRLKDVQLSFQLKQTNLKAAFLKNAEVYFYASNLGIIWRANNKGIDPDYGQYLPAPVSVAVGFKTNF